MFKRLLQRLRDWLQVGESTPTPLFVEQLTPLAKPRSQPRSICTTLSDLGEL